MQTKHILQLFMPYIQKEIENLTEKLKQTWNLKEFEEDVLKLMAHLEACLIGHIVDECLKDATFLDQLKVLAGKLGMKFKEYRPLQLHLSNGLQITIASPYFLKSTGKRGRKKKGPNGRGKHLGLAVMGILGQATPTFLSQVVQMALLCPSFEVAKEVLAEQGVIINVKTIRRYCRLIGEAGMKWRGKISLDGTETLTGVTMVVGIDGGRLRERRCKRGRWKKGQKRAGFHTDWREPKLFTIYFLNGEGKVISELAPLHDATMGDHQAVFTLLKQYLTALPVAEVDKLVFCGDGAPWIWSDVVTLCAEMALDMTKVHQVLDYTHAKQQLGILLDYVGKRKRKKEKLDSKWHGHLWNGDIDLLKKEIEQQCVGKKQVAALNKWRKYFKKNESRMQYQAFKKQAIPCGSGSVESAIRRVINLRLKAPGSFWLIEMAEAFLFLRSQLISGRWSIMIRNLTRQMARTLLRIHDENCLVNHFQPRLTNHHGG